MTVEDELERFFTREIQHRRTPGAVVLCQIGDDLIFSKAYGYRDYESQDYMRLDTIFRLTSMTKIVSTIAALSLMESGLLRLSDKVSTYIPEFAKMFVRIDDSDDVAPARREIYIKDLLRHTSGLSYGHMSVADMNAYKKLDLYFSLNTDSTLTNEEAAQRLSTLPLNFHPGEKWVYSRSMDVLGRIMEAITGLSMIEILRERVLNPLEMVDTEYNLKKEKVLRVAAPLPDYKTKEFPDLFDPSLQRAYLCAGEGLFTTANDFGNICRMLLNKGRFRNRQVLSRKTVEYMTSDHIGRLRFAPEYGLDEGLGYGLGVYVRKTLGGTPSPGSIGEFGWWGGTGQAFWVDPIENMFCVLMMQQIDEERYFAETVRSFLYRLL